MTAADITRQWLDIIHKHVDVAESSIQNALQKIADAGWHPDTIECRTLANDVNTLRPLAAQCEAKLKELTKETTREGI
jgi:site-specific recombinase